WANGDKNLHEWRESYAKIPFETEAETSEEITEQEFFDKGILLVAFIKAGCELAFETMVSAGIKPESAYYESLHEVPLIANLIDRRRLYEMNKVISDTAEYGCYLFARACVPLLGDFMKNSVTTADIGKGMDLKTTAVPNKELVQVNEAIRNHPIEEVGKKLRAYMTSMKALV
ncbi:MAG: ketol-acid reductoisomerase, partial [Bacteroidales bacterium]|nr:ketol-acid reductoisomerase [Bacteroidales bacterium]